MKRRTVNLYLFLGILALIALLAFYFAWVPKYYPQIVGKTHLPHIQKAISNIFRERSAQLIAMLMSATLIAFSALAFQTTTNNRILTPSSLGFDSIYAVTQTLLVVSLGFIHPFLTNAYLNFILTTVIMIVIVLLMYALVLRKNKNNIVLLLLIGIIIASLASSVSNVIQAMMSDDEFYSVQAITSVSITNINGALVYGLIPVMLIVMYLLFKPHKSYDIMALGEAHATNLGVNYPSKSKYILTLVAIAVAISTALVGPLSFLGLLAVNLARELAKRYEHKHLFIFSALLAVIFLFFGQALVEVTGYRTTVTTLISLIGGGYMIYLLLRRKD